MWFIHNLERPSSISKISNFQESKNYAGILILITVAANSNPYR
jgi:hypothetical protein